MKISQPVKLSLFALVFASSLALGEGGATAQAQTTGNSAAPATGTQGNGGAVSQQGQYNAQPPAGAQHPTEGEQTNGPNGAVSGVQPAK